MEHPDIPLITIDGPGGSGKGTLSRLLARRLGWHWLDSGAIYRLLALAALKSNTALDDSDALSILAKNLDIHFQEDSAGEPVVLLGTEDVSAQLRTESCGKTASTIAALGKVRIALLERQQAFLRPPGLVADGRDMGTIVFPFAKFKVFLTASLEERARRRHKQLKDQGFEFSMDALFREISARDERDCNRKVAPLRPADDAIVVDCSSISIEEMLGQVLTLAAEKGFLPVA
ncbi:MAG: (d)CMP kinase [Thiothrix sp.]|nr:MAG: (d)CMP kinase [Thiothrix sp.]